MCCVGACKAGACSSADSRPCHMCVCAWQKEVKFDFRPVHNNPLYKEEMDTVKPFTRVY